MRDGVIGLWRQPPLMKISIPGMDKAAAERLVKAAHEVCPYSNATRGNIEVTLSVV